MAVVEQRYTLADLLDMPAGGNDLYEILGGELVVFSSPDEAHASTVTALFRLLIQAQDAGFGRARTAPRSVAFDFQERGLQARDVTMPDLFLVVPERRSILGRRVVEAAPDLVVEVLSPSTREDDLPGGRKWAIYERYGVRYYWIADHETRTISLYEWRDGRFGEPIVLRPGDVLSCPLFPDITCDVAAIFTDLA